MRAGSSARQLLAAIALLCAFAGCGPEPVRRAVQRADDPVDGYAWTAMLMSTHPLWGALRDLERSMDELGAAQWETALVPVERRFTDVAFTRSFALEDPQPRISALTEQWRAGYPPLTLGADGLGQDLQARIEWERGQAERMVAQRLAAARSAESRRLAQMRAEMVAYYQERLTNLGIQATIRTGEAAAAAEAEQRRVWAIIEAEMAAAAEAGEQELAALEARLRQQAVERVEQARERARAISGERRETMQAAGAELYDRMIARMQEPWPMPEVGEVSAGVEADPANVRLNEIELSHEAAEAARREKIVEQQRQMAEAIARLRSQIRDGTETAAEIVAYRNGIRLQTLPGGRRRGNDVTNFIAEKLEGFWAVDGGQRS